MKILTELLRNLLYHPTGPPRQGGGLITTAVLAFAGYTVANSADAGALFARLQHLVHYLVYLIVSALVLNVVLKHSNELLELLLNQRRTTERESRRMMDLLKKLLGITPAEPKDQANSKSTEPDRPSDQSDSKKTDPTVQN